MTTNPETPLIQKLAETRLALEAEREALLARVAAIDEALAVGTVSTAPKAVKSVKPTKESKASKPGLREAITGSLVGKSGGLTIRQIQEALPTHPPKSIESLTHTMATAGKLAKDNSSPKRFSLPA